MPAEQQQPTGAPRHEPSRHEPSRHEPPRHEPSRQEPWQRELRARGYRLTPQRQHVLEAVNRLGHATPDEIAAELRTSAAEVNLSTVYRALELLEELGLVTHAHLGHNALTYHAVGDETHVHLVCRRCEAVDEMPAAELDELAHALSSQRGFILDRAHVALFGLCARCAAREHPPH